MKCIVRIRGDIGQGIKPEALPINGKTFNFDYGWEITQEDSCLYEGEAAWIANDPSYPGSAPRWIASGDLMCIQ